MGAAVIAVMVIATAVTFPLQIFLLDAYNLGYLQTIIFILVIAVLVQLIEITLKKYVPALYQSLGVYLPLITTNCCVLGVTILAVQDYSAVVAEFGFGLAYAEALVCAAGAGVGFLVAMLLFCGVRSRVEAANPPESFKGLPITLVSAAITSLSFMGFWWVWSKPSSSTRYSKKGNGENEPDRICYRCRGGAGPGRRRDPCAGLQVHGCV